MRMFDENKTRNDRRNEEIKQHEKSVGLFKPFLIDYTVEKRETLHTGYREFSFIVISSTTRVNK